jgi:hypothetical protein
MESFLRLVCVSGTDRGYIGTTGIEKRLFAGRKTESYV